MWLFFSICTDSDATPTPLPYVFYNTEESNPENREAASASNSTTFLSITLPGSFFAQLKHMFYHNHKSFP